MTNKLLITEPILESDFVNVLRIVEENICRDKNFDSDYFKSLSFGEVLLAKFDNEVVGVLTQRRPGRIFQELSDKFFALDQIKSYKSEIGFIVLVSVDPKYQKKNIGKKLVKKALKLQAEWNSKAVGVHSWQASPGGGSQKLFESCGFQALKLHKSPWLEHAKKVGPKGYWCVVCGHPCGCDELEMIKYL